MPCYYGCRFLWRRKYKLVIKCRTKQIQTQGLVIDLALYSELSDLQIVENSVRNHLQMKSTSNYQQLSSTNSLPAIILPVPQSKMLQITIHRFLAARRRKEKETTTSILLPLRASSYFDVTIPLMATVKKRPKLQPRPDRRRGSQPTG